MLEKSLKENDEIMYNLLEKEKERQKEKLLLNAAISITPKSVLKIQGSILDNIDAEGYIPEYLNTQNIIEIQNIDKQIKLYKKYKDNRFNKCCEYANIIEALAQKRLAKVFENENTKEIFVNVQAPTGAIANFVVYEALLKPNDIILSLGTKDGGHSTHGDETHESGKKYNVINYHISMEKNDIDYNEIEELLLKNKPNLIIAGASSFPLNINWKKIRELINKNSPKTLFMADIAHTAGLVAGKVFNNPIGIADVTTFVTYKTFCGPRAAAIITTNKELANKIDETLFPQIMGSPLLLGIAGIAVSANLALKDEYKKMQQQIVKNSRILCTELLKLNIPVVFEKSDTHIVLLDCNEYATGKEVADSLEDCNILVNSCKVPSKYGYHEGIRIGTTVITQNNFTEEKIKIIAKIIAKVLNSLKNKDKIDYIKIKDEISKII